jgi:hypothetical protein
MHRAAVAQQASFMAPTQSCPVSLSPPPSFPSPVSSPWPLMELQLCPWLPFHEESQPSSFFFVGQPKRMHTISHLLSSPSILSEMNSNLWILRDFVFQLNSDFISNSNINPSRLLLHPYISLDAPPHVSPCQFPLKIQPLLNQIAPI